MAEESLLPSQQPSPSFAFKTKDFKRVFVIMSLFAFIQMGFDTILPVAVVSPARLSGMELSKEDLSMIIGCVSPFQLFLGMSAVLESLE